MNEIWEVLGIAPTGDKRAIRSAYSVLVKQCHPEEDPQGFKRLHEAYQAALAYAAGKENIIEPAGEKDGEQKPGREEKSGRQQLDIKTREEEGSKEES